MSSHRVFAAFYERLLAANEDAGLRALRADLIGSARGRTLELGAGTGLNVPHFSAAVTELVLSEPDPAMAKRLRRRLEQAPPAGDVPVQVIEAAAESLPFPDASFDTVIATLVLCSVTDPESAVSEVTRVLKPGGRFLFAEHVRDEPGTRRARWQDRLSRPWSACMGGCHPNRQTDRVIADAFPARDARYEAFPGPGSALIRRLMVGLASR